MSGKMALAGTALAAGGGWDLYRRVGAHLPAWAASYTAATHTLHMHLLRAAVAQTAHDHLLLAGAGGVAIGGLVAVAGATAGREDRARRAKARASVEDSLLREEEREKLTGEKAALEAAEVARERARQAELERGGWYDPAAGGWPLGVEVESGRPTYLPRLWQARHPLVNGGTGSGKTATMLLRWIYHEASLPADKRASLILIDPKDGGELTTKSIGYLRERGYRVWVYDPLSEGSLRFNVAALCSDADSVVALVEQWVKSLGEFHSYYGPMNVAVIAGLLLYLRDSATQDGRDWRCVSLADVARWIREHQPEETASTVLAHVLAARGLGRKIEPALEDLAGQLMDMQASKGAQGQVMGGVRLRLKCLTGERVAASMAGSSGENDMGEAFWREFVRVPTALYMPIDMDTAETIAPVIVTGMTGAVTALRRVAAGRPLERPVRIITDEAANVRIAGLARIVSTARSSDIGLAFATQGPTDIVRVYGAKEGERIMTNLLTHIVLSQSNEKDLKYYTNSALGVELEGLMEEGTAYIRRAGRLPVRVYTAAWFEDRKLSKAVEAASGRYSKATALAHQAEGHAAAAPAAERAKGEMGNGDGDGDGESDGWVSAPSAVGLAADDADDADERGDGDLVDWDDWANDANGDGEDNNLWI